MVRNNAVRKSCEVCEHIKNSLLRDSNECAFNFTTLNFIALTTFKLAIIEGITATDEPVFFKSFAIHTNAHNYN